MIVLALSCFACGSAAPETRPATVVVTPAAQESESDGTPPDSESRSKATCTPEGTEASVEKGRQLFMEGAELYERGEYEAAAQSFRGSYDLTCNALLLYNVAKAYEQLGDLEGALGFYERFIATADPGPRVEEMKRHLEELKQRTR